MKQVLKILGTRIRQERKHKGLTQERLAELIDVSNNFISYIETGKKPPSLKTLIKISDALDIDIADLFKDIPEKRKQKRDYTEEKIIYLLRDKKPATKKLMLELCKTVAQKQEP